MSAMSDEVKPQVIKHTQETLGKHVKKPSLTDKLLKKPPFRFLHDIVTNVIRSTAFLHGLYTDHELDSGNMTDRDSKVAFLQKLIDALKTTTGLDITARPSKIVAGLEPTKTNELLQAIAYALDNKLDNSAALRQPKKAKSKDDVNAKNKPGDNKTLKKQVSVTKRETAVKKPEKPVKKVKSLPHHNENATNSSRTTKQPEKNAAAEIKSEKTQEVMKVSETVEIKGNKADETATVLSDMNVDETVTEENHIVKETEEAQVDQEEARVSEEKKTPRVEEIVRKIDEIVPNRPRTSLRPPSVRPSSGRPGAPRLKERTHEHIPMEQLIPMGKVNVIIENYTDKQIEQDNDNEEETVVLDMSTTELAVDKQPLEIPAEQGHLVTQILTQLQTTNTEIEMDADVKQQPASNTSPSATSHDMQNLRDLIQTLTRAANPLGKLVHFVQEDFEAMTSELEVWTRAASHLGEDIAKQRAGCELILQPLREQLAALEDTVQKQNRAIRATHANILNNHSTISKLLLSKVPH